MTNTGSVYTWGCGSDGQCGHGTLRDAARPKLVENLVGKTIVDVKCGHNFTMVMTSSHEVFAWGNNTYGQLGNNGNGKNSLPVQVIINSSARVASVACAHFHCILWMQVTEPVRATNSAGSIRPVSAIRAKGKGEAVDEQTAAAKKSLLDASERLAPLLETYKEKKENCFKVLEREKEIREKALADILALA